MTGSARLTASSCRTSMSEAFSEMLPTNTVVVGPPLPASSASRGRKGSRASFLGAAGFGTMDTAGGSSTCSAGDHIIYTNTRSSLTGPRAAMKTHTHTQGRQKEPIQTHTLICNSATRSAALNSMCFYISDCCHGVSAAKSILNRVSGA